jgi:hypothetical protein
MLADVANPAYRPPNWEEKLVCFADKLVDRDRIVSLEERFAALRERYPNGTTALERYYPEMQALEQEITALLGMAPAVLLAGLGDYRTVEVDPAPGGN